MPVDGTGSFAVGNVTLEGGCTASFNSTGYRLSSPERKEPQLKKTPP